MTVGVLNIQPLSFSQANPMLEGMSTEHQLLGQTLANQLAMLKNQQTAAQNQMLPQTLAANLQSHLLKNQVMHSQIPLNQARTQLAWMQVNHPPLQSPMGKALADKQRAIEHYGKSSNQVKAINAYINKLSQSRNGINFNMNPGGGVSFSIGGASDPNATTITKNPMFGSYRSAAGGTYELKQNGKNKTISTPTNTMTTANQQAMSGAQRVQPMLEDLMKKMPQFQSAWTGAASDIEGYMNRYLGTNFNLPSQRAAAKADIATSAEGLIKTYGLRVSEKALQMMEDAIKPVSGESPEGYKNRILATINHIQSFQSLAAKYQRQGFNVSAQRQSSNQKSAANDPLGIR